MWCLAVLHYLPLFHSRPPSKLAMKSTNLAPLKMPQPVHKSSKPDSMKSDTPNPDSTTGTPGSDGSNTASPVFPYPYPHMQGPVRVPSPLTVTVVSNYHKQVNENAEHLQQQPVPFPVRAPGILLEQRPPAYPQNFDRRAGDPIHGFTDEEQHNFFQHGSFEAEPKPLLMISQQNTYPLDENPQTQSGGSDEPTDSLVDSNQVRSSSTNTNFSQSTSSSANPSFEDKTRLFNRPAEPLEMDENGRVKSYIDFSDFMTTINAMGGEKVVFADFIGRIR